MRMSLWGIESQNRSFLSLSSTQTDCIFLEAKAEIIQSLRELSPNFSIFYEILSKSQTAKFTHFNFFEL